MGHKAELGTDTKGVYRRYIGWKEGNSERPVQHLFRLGRDKERASAANARLEQLWGAVVERWRRWRAANVECPACPLWDDTTLAIGAAVAKGESACVLQPPERLNAGAAASWLAVLQVQFPMCVLRLPEHLMGAGVEELHRQEEQAKLNLDVTETMLTALGEQAGGGLYDALDAYGRYLDKLYEGKPNLRCVSRVLALVKRHATDIGLAELDADQVETWLAYWCKRPDHNGKPLARTTCRAALARIRAFLRWLHRSSYRWQMPDGFTFPRCKIADTATDYVAKLRRKHFKVSELVTLWRYAMPYQRALMLLALNCGFSRREVATLQVAEIVDGAKHKFIKRHRTKTGVYAEWVLWPETVAALAYLAKFRKAGATYAVANEVGRPLTWETDTTIHNHWCRLLARVVKDIPGFHVLSFKYLRKTGATYVRKMKVENAAELASMYLSHGEQADSADTLLPVYTSRPWRKLHKVLFRLRKKLLPVLTSVEEPWDEKRPRTSPVVIARAKELRAEGKTFKDIGAEVGVHEGTVRRLLGQR
jgi:integrase